MSANYEIITSHFHRAAPGLFRQPAGCLRNPFIVPGAQYGAELWDWDAYWTTLGLLHLARVTGDDSIRTEAIRHGQGSLLNFFEHQTVSGAIPIMMKADNPDVFGCIENQGIERNHAKPIFGQFALALIEAGQGGRGEAGFLKITIPALERFYAHWENRYRHAGTGLLVWGSDVAIGVDNDPTTYARPPFSSANLLLNCLYHADLEAAAALAERSGENALAMRWRSRATELAQAISIHCWDERDGFFYTLDVQCADHRTRLIPWAKPGAPLAWSALPMRIQMFTGFLPLWRGIATHEQAKTLFQHATNPDAFAASAGIRSLSRRESMYSLAVSSNPSNWNGPVWILSNYLVWKGLVRYGFADEAAELAEKTLHLLASDITANGATHEYYDPDTGRPIMNKGFISWNLLACAMLGDV